MNNRWLAFEALGNSFKDLTEHASTTFLCAAVLGLPVLLSATISAAGTPILGGLLTLFSMLFVAGWLPFAITLATKQYAVGQDPGPGGLLDLSASPRLLSYLGTQILFSLLLFVVVLAGLLPLLGVGLAGFLRGSLTSGMALTPRLGALGIAAMVVFVPVIIGMILFVYLRYGLVAPVNALEGTSPSRAFARSRKLLKGRKMDFFVMLLIIFVINAVISLILSGPGMIVSIAGLADRPRTGGTGFYFSPFEMMGRRDSLPPFAALLVGVSTYLSSVVSAVLMAITVSNYYLSARGQEVADKAGSLPNESDPQPGPVFPSGETYPDPSKE